MQIAVVTSVLTLSVLAGANSGGLDIGAGHIVAASAGLCLLALLIGAIALLLGAATGKRPLTLGFAALVAVLVTLAGFSRFFRTKGILDRLPARNTTKRRPLPNSWPSSRISRSSSNAWVWSG
ncbi:hypothetical protein [Nocardia xishanensis]